MLLVIVGVMALAVLLAYSQASSAQATRSSTNPPPAPSPTPEANDDPDVVRVETNLVNTLFTAVDKDRHFITSLRAADIQIFENDVPQTISLFERETDRALSLAILVDTSESQRGVLGDEKTAAASFIDSVIRPVKDSAAVVSFTGVPKVEQEPTNDLAKLREGIARVKIELSPENERRLAEGDDPLPKDKDPTGYTGIWDAMWMAIADLLVRTPEGTRRAIVLLSDGDDTSSTIKRQDVIDYAIKSEVVIYSIGIRDAAFQEGKLDSGALRKISDRTGGRAFFPTRTSELQAAFAQIDQELRSQYLIAYSPTNKIHDGSYRRIRMEVLNPDLRQSKAQLLYRQGYYAKKN